MGGDKRSERIETLGPEIFALVEEAVHITLAEIAERLESQHGERFAPSTVHRFFRRHVITRDGFVMTSRGHQSYAETLRRKIKREVSQVLF